MPETIQAETVQVDAKSPPSSRRERKKERTRREIYTAAIELFLERGFDAVTVENICHAADVARGTFFLHFPTKDSLLLEYGAQVTQELSQLLQAQRSSAAEALHKMLIFLTERATDHADIVRLVVREVMAHPVALADATEQGRDLLHLMSAEVRRGQHTGEFLPNVEPRLAAGIIVAAYFAIVTEWVRCEGKFNLAEAVQQSLDIVLNGLATKRAKK